MHRFAFILLLFALPAQAADPMVLSCIPDRSPRTPGIDAYVDAFAEGEYPPKTVNTLRVLTRFGEDVYEFFPEQVKEIVLRDGALSIHMLQPLSAGETAEMRFEGKLAAKKSEPFLMQFSIRNERRTGTGQLRCTID